MTALTSSASYIDYAEGRALPSVATLPSLAKPFLPDARVSFRIGTTLLLPLLSSGTAMAAVHMQPTVQACRVHADYAEGRSALVRQLLEYGNFPEDWDGYGGQPARPSSIFDALEFLANFSSGIVPPSPMLSGNGTIGLYWDIGGRYASLEFEGDRTYSYLTDGPDGFGGEDAIPAGVVATGLIDFIREAVAIG